MEFLLGQYCSSDDPSIIEEGVENVKRILADNYVRPDEAQKILSVLRQKGSYTVIDKITVNLNIKKDTYEAEFSNLGVKDIPIAEEYPSKFDRLLCGGIWCIVQLEYEYIEEDKKASQIVSRLTPDWFNLEVRRQYKQSIVDGTPKRLPIIGMEVYFEGVNDEDIIFLHYRGTNNVSREDAIGIRLKIAFNDEYSDTYKQLLSENKIIDIPVEMYKVEFSSFAQPEYYVGSTSKKVAIIDTTKKDYGAVLNRFVANTITTYLSEEDETNLRLAYRGNRKDFTNSDAVKSLNQKLSDDHKFGNKKVSLNLREGEIDNWKNEMSLSVDGIPFENTGFGTQNMIKSEMVFNQNIPL